MKRVLDFLKELRENNNREWFNANKQRFLEVQDVCNSLAEQLIAEIGKFDPSVGGLTVRDCTYRIYRDTRFSHDKTPYKTHTGIYVCPGGKKSGNAGYYLHIEPEGGGLIGRHMMSAGIYMPETAVLKSIRDEIYDNGDEVEGAIRKAAGFSLDETNKLKRPPAGFPPGSHYGEYLKHKDFYLVKYLDDDYILSDGLARRAAADFRKTYDFIVLMNRAAGFARDPERWEPDSM